MQQSERAEKLKREVWKGIIKGDLRRVKKLFKFQKVDLSQPINPIGMAAIHQACVSEKEEILKYLLELFQESESKKHIDQIDRYHRTAFHFAAATGNISLCKMLLNAGANINAQTIGGETPLMKAAQFGHQDLVDWFKKQKGILSGAKNKKQMDIDKMLKVQFNVERDSKQTQNQIQQEIIRQSELGPAHHKTQKQMDDDDDDEEEKLDF